MRTAFDATSAEITVGVVLCVSKALSVSMPYLVVILLFGILNFLTFTVRMGMRM
ncbi:hypothetical protein [Desulfosporosinus metallidurans]|uniref:Nitrogen assimilation regulatory protein n=1 Tax=Desulfosporosinus metallidurans TaxID=1888891 RepID=A0A1Q8QN56_9FIRM|nr:hypothetical protein [Desulfosporosinus metallidurans]OLN28773.1 Nitrogen assimilation regulatory protein [Desulfosporosinus metallidurans]